MNLLLVANGFPPSSYGGVEAYTDDLAKGLFRRGHQVTVFCRESAPARSDYEQVEDQNAPFPVYRVVNDFKRVPTFSGLYADPKIDQIFDQLLNSIRPDVVHFNHFLALSSGLPKICQQHGIPSVITLHDYWPICHRINLINAHKKSCPGPLQGADCFDCVFLAGERRSGLRNLAFFYLKQLIPYPIRSRLRQRIRRPGFEPLLFQARREDFVQRNRSFQDTLNCGAYVSAPSQFVRQMYRLNGFSAREIQVLPLGVEKLAHVARPSSRESIIFAFIGTLLSVKGVDVLIRAFSALPFQNIKLSIYGREDVEPHFTKHIHDIAQADARIQFLGPFLRDKKQEIYQVIDVLVIPSITPETFSFVAREALESGIPVVASPVGALQEIIHHEKNGFLFPAGNVQALQSILEKIARNPSLLTGLSCPGDVEVLTVEDHITQMEDIYLKIQ